MEITKALATLKPLYNQPNIEVVTADGTSVRGIVRSMKMTQALTKPSVKIEQSDGSIIKVILADVTNIINHNEK